MTYNHVIKVCLRHPDNLQTKARCEAARCWNDMVRLHKYCRKRHWKWPTEKQLKAHCKNRYNLHSQTVQGLVEKLIGNIESTRTKRKEGDKNARYPWRCKKRFQTVIWKEQAIKRNGNRIVLSMGQGRKPLKIKVPFNSLPFGKIVIAELSFRELRLTIQEVQETVSLAGNNVVAADLGIIHTAVLTDGQSSLGIVGRSLRSLHQYKNRKLAQYTTRIDHCKDGSHRKRKLKRSKARMLAKYHRQAHNLLHHAANQMIGFCIEQKAGTLVVGDVTDIARNKRKHKKGSRRSNQENSGIPLAQLVSYLKYKGKRQGVKVEKINEAYTSQTCPKCSHRHKPSSRVYRCTNPECRYQAPRDEVGAINILCKYLHGGMRPNVLLPTEKIKYQRPVKLPVIRPDVVVPLTWDKLPDTTLLTVPTPLGVDSQLSLALEIVA